MWHYTKAPVNVRAGWTVYCGDDPIADVLADCDDSRARLIAKAPELRAALRRFVDYFGDDDTDNGLEELISEARALLED